jgi:hypothetical protein
MMAGLQGPPQCTCEAAAVTATGRLGFRFPFAASKFIHLGEYTPLLPDPSRVFIRGVYSRDTQYSQRPVISPLSNIRLQSSAVE